MQENIITQWMEENLLKQMVHQGHASCHQCHVWVKLWHMICVGFVQCISQEILMTRAAYISMAVSVGHVCEKLKVPKWQDHLLPILTVRITKFPPYYLKNINVIWIVTSESLFHTYILYIYSFYIMLLFVKTIYDPL